MWFITSVFELGRKREEVGILFSNYERVKIIALYKTKMEIAFEILTYLSELRNFNGNQK